MNFKLILGGPGTGKTEHLVRLVLRELSDGLSPEDIAFVAFTRVAATEARQRAARALEIGERQLPHFRTLHSLCFRELGLRRRDVLDGAPLRELEELTGEKAKRDTLDGDAGPWEVDGLAKATGRDPEELAMAMGLDIHRFRRAIAARDQFKKDRGLVDFTDMLTNVAVGCKPIDVKLAIIDEVQDLTPLQWETAEKLFHGVPRIIVAGDDDQAIHEWAGSTIAPLLGHHGEREVLTKSHRLPFQIHTLAQGVINSLAHRLPKDTEPADRVGSVTWYGDPTEVPIHDIAGTWLLLTRARYQMTELIEMARAAGVPYRVHGKSSINQELLDAAVEYENHASPGDKRWHDVLTKFPLEEREYLLACRRGGEKLNEIPRVSIDTVHGAKGRQADHVLLLTDLTARIHHRAERDPDAEQRVLYVGLTRASESLHIVQSRGIYAWNI